NADLAVTGGDQQRAVGGLAERAGGRTIAVEVEVANEVETALEPAKTAGLRVSRNGVALVQRRAVYLAAEGCAAQGFGLRPCALSGVRSCPCPRPAPS